MEIYSPTRVPVTTLPSRDLGGLAMAWQGRPRGASVTTPAAAAFQGGAMAVTGRAAVTTSVVTDHPFTTRLGSASCSPPV